MYEIEFETTEEFLKIIERDARTRSIRTEIWLNPKDVERLKELIKS
jgi:hypothetical protein